MNPKHNGFYTRLLAAAAAPVVLYAAGSFLLPSGKPLTAFGNLMQCLVPLLASAGMLANAASPHWRRNLFWMLLSLGCTMWLAGQLMWTYFEVHLEQAVPNPFLGDVVFFLHTVPLIAALALQPHRSRLSSALRLGYLDFSFLLLWWLYLYAFIVIPWQFVEPDLVRYGNSYNALYHFENTVFVLGLGWFTWTSSGPWRRVYAHLFCAATVYTLGSLTLNTFIDLGKYYTGSLYDLPLVASFVWFGAAGLIAHHLELPGEPAEETPEQSEAEWPARLAMVGVLSLPIMAFWVMLHPDMPDHVRDFRLALTLLGMLVFTSLLFLRQVLDSRERSRLLLGTRDALENLKRLQTQFVQSEKLASLGKLASGAAHEINNPLTAILGYADLLGEDEGLTEKQHSLAEKIREQARRTKTLVHNLLSFARQTPTEKSLLDINPVVTNAIQLRQLDLRAKNIRIHVQAETVLPGVRCDANQMLQVFYNLINNAVEAMEETGGGTLTVVTKREKNNVVIEFADTGPGIKEPQFVFDPFYTTKPVGKGTGLGLSICYGIVQEHGGSISCYNRHQGGATFHVELPAVTAVLPKSAADAEKARSV